MLTTLEQEDGRVDATLGAEVTRRTRRKAEPKRPEVPLSKDARALPAEPPEGEQLRPDLDFETPYTIGFTVKGVKPFFFNRYDVDEFFAKDASPPGSRKRKEHDVEKLVWRAENAELAVPGLEFHKALMAAGRYMKDPSGTGRRSARPFLAEALVPDEDLCSFGTKKWDEVDVRPVKLKNGSVIPKERPIMKPGWTTTVHISVTMPELLSPAQLVLLMQRAGVCRGVGDGSTIGMGRYVVVHVEEPRELAWA